MTFVNEKGYNPALFVILKCNDVNNLIDGIIVKNTYATNYLIK